MAESSKDLIHYKRAISHLIDVASHRTSGGREAARVLLSAYDGYTYKLAVHDLALLDVVTFERAMSVIRCRAQLGIEPHEIADEGEDGIKKIASMWSEAILKDG